MVDTWSLIQNLFSREQSHLQHIARLENSLANAGVRNQHDRAAYNSLQLQYDKLNRAYTLLYEEHDRLKHELANLRSH